VQGRGWRRRESTLAFVLALALYLLVGTYLTFGTTTVIGDAWSRVGNAYYVLFSRDPHLAAIGFVWNPLPSLAMMPVLLFSVIWPPLVAEGFAATVVSAVFMAATVAVMRGLLQDIGLRFTPRWILTLLFALNPMILLYGSNGLSEGPFLLFVLLAVRSLLRWERRDAGADLVIAGLALGLAYLTRYEAVAVAGAAIGGVGILSFLRAHGPVRGRLTAGAADALLVAFPFVVSFGGWSLASWIIVGSPFATFTSVYGNTSQVGIAGTGITGAVGDTSAARIIFFGRELAGLAPGLAPLAALTLLLMLVRRSVRALVPIAIFGSALAFSGWALASGSSFGWLRFAIMSIPLSAVLGGMLLAPRYGVVRLAGSQAGEPDPGDPAPLSPSLGARLAARLVRGAVTVVVVASLAVGFPTALRSMSDNKLGREEAGQLEALRDPSVGPTTQYGRVVVLAQEAAAYIDGLHLAKGTVLVDVATGYPIVLASRNPQQFVITPDRDFPQTLRDPGAFGIRFLLVPRDTGYAAVDALTRTYPGLYEQGSGFGPMVQQFGLESDTIVWRLYELVASP
jgi:hypothetical protein